MQCYRMVEFLLIVRHMQLQRDIITLNKKCIDLSSCHTGYVPNLVKKNFVLTHGTHQSRKRRQLISGPHQMPLRNSSEFLVLSSLASSFIFRKKSFSKCFEIISTMANLITPVISSSVVNVDAKRGGRDLLMKTHDSDGHLDWLT